MNKTFLYLKHQIQFQNYYFFDKNSHWLNGGDFLQQKKDVLIL